MTAIIIMRIITTVIAALGVVLFLWLTWRNKQGRGFRFHGLVALIWLLANYLTYWITGEFPGLLHIAGATLALVSYIVAGGIYAALSKR